jgi:hypothetical protein
MPYIREPILTPVSIEELHPTQITVGMREVEGQTQTPASAARRRKWASFSAII